MDILTTDSITVNVKTLELQLKNGADGTASNLAEKKKQEKWQ